jgi:hypothetical protein
MLTFTALGTSISSSSETWTLEFRYADICTNFDHPSGATSFSGNGRINTGEAFRIFTDSSFIATSISIGTAPAMVLGLQDATYQLTGSATWTFTGIGFANPYGGFYTHNGTLIGSVLAASLIAYGFQPVSSSFFGEIFGEMGNTDGPISFGSAPFLLSRGGSCPV